MPRFGPSHISVLLATALIVTLFCWLARSHPRGTLPTRLAWTLGIILIVSKLTTLIYAALQGTLTWQNGLPMHLCDWATFTSLFALYTRNQTAYELTYFWGLAGTFQAVLTPDLAFDFPDIRFITFFVSHCGIIVALLYLTLGLGLRPTWKSVLKVVVLGQVYLLAAALANWLTGANYGYLSAKPIHASLLDQLGPWPYYILSLEVLAVILYTIIYLPFAFYDMSQKSRAAVADPV